MTTAMFRLCDVSLDRSFGGSDVRTEREHAIAVCDLLENNTFVPIGHSGGPYRLKLASAEGRLALHVATENGAHVISHYLSIAPFRRLLKDYVLTCESFYDAMPCACTARFEAIDMGRRALHDAAAELLRERLAPKVTVDKNTARRLFTLIYVLLMRNTSLVLGSHETKRVVRQTFDSSSGGRIRNSKG
ncbi:UPF0262 family protein [Ensifer sp. IC3342]|nr:UPF0262 family protein [Ensifer sp. BRP08]MCA1451147.1 UPF0262 family protein [Ensifer sp. IC3342]